jgi:FHS family L-fucose permease-like MFS transporter
LAWIIGPLIALSIYGNQSHVEGEKLVSLIVPMAAIGIVVFLVALVFMRLRLPEISEEDALLGHGNLQASTQTTHTAPLRKQRHFVLGVIAQFCYVAAQTGVFSYLINFVTDEGQTPRFDVKNGPYFLSIGFALFMVGRMSGSFLMGFVKPNRLLALYAGLCVALLPVVSLNFGWVSLIALYAVFFLMSIMFPTIFALGIKGLGSSTKKGSSFLVMAVVGGALFPPIMGYVSDIYGMSTGFFVPIPLFLFILFYGLIGFKTQVAT